LYQADEMCNVLAMKIEIFKKLDWLLCSWILDHTDIEQNIIKMTNIKALKWWW